ncbi:hypothetical protein HYV31_02710 [candidate division WWE3 bacterium]|nr:hypothetical protein [candidate division WWE3 bacterium]
MELKELLTHIKNNWRILAGSTLIGLLVGLGVFYFVPVGYRAVGSIFVARESEFSRKADYTYEGYYALQTAKNYAKTLIGILESVDIRKTALEIMGVPITENTLREARRNVSIKEAAPQLVSIQVKDKDFVKASEYWKTLSAEALKTSDKLNMRGDEKINLIVMDGSPVVYKAFHNIWVDMWAGIVLGLVFGVVVISFKEYLKK